MFGRRREIPGNERTVTAVVCDPPRLAVMLASLGLATNTRSPMSDGGGRSAKHVGVQGFGANRFNGRTAPPQDFRGASVPVAYPAAPKVGQMSGVTGASGMPGTAGPPGSQTLALMTMSQMGQGWS